MDGLLAITNKTIRFDYINWRGESSKRNVIVGDIYWGHNQFHPENQLLMGGYDLDKASIRFYAMKDMKNIEVI